MREEEHVNLVLPDPRVPRGRRLAELHDLDRTVVIQGPERVAIVGANGTGKSTLVEQIMGLAPPSAGRPYGHLLTDLVGYLPQRLDGLDEDASAMANVQSVAPGSPAGAIRNQLARLLLRGDSADRPVSSLSGGERFRVSLAKLLLAEPPAQVLVLDEPTNNLDITSVGQLAEALDAYGGALFVVSHDFAFLDRIRIDTVVELGQDGHMRQRRDLDV